MAGERRVDEITVGDLVARAGVSRQVFYRHFRDRDDAVALAVTGAFAAAVGPGPEKPRPAASAATGHGNDPATVEDIDARSASWSCSSSPPGTVRCATTSFPAR